MPADPAAAPVLAAPVRTPIGKFGGRLAAAERGISRRQADEWAALSQQRCAAARDGRLGLATLCVSGGMGLAALVEREAV